MWQISRVIGMAFLTGLSIEDLRFRKVSREWLCAMAILGMGYQMCTKEASWRSVLGGAGIGLVFLCISYITREALGYGDSILICILGIFVGAAELLEILVITWTIVGIVSMILLVCRHFSRKTALPFVPFLSLGYSVVSICAWLPE